MVPYKVGRSTRLDCDSSPVGGVTGYNEPTVQASETGGHLEASQSHGQGLDKDWERLQPDQKGKQRHLQRDGQQQDVPAGGRGELKAEESKNFQSNNPKSSRFCDIFILYNTFDRAIFTFIKAYFVVF